MKTVIRERRNESEEKSCKGANQRCEERKKNMRKIIRGPKEREREKALQRENQRKRKKITGVQKGFVEEELATS